MTIYTPITPTYLYIKQHSVTGLKYFGKTTKDPYLYNGSGKHWTNHIKIHGREHVITLWVSDPFHDTSIVEHAIHFSIENNIVESTDWANLKPENGLDGGGQPKGSIRSNEAKTRMSTAHKGKKLSDEHKAKISAGGKGKILKPLSDKHKANISASKMGKKRGSPSEETREKLSVIQKGKPKSDETKAKMSKPKSDEHKAKISATKKGKKLSDEHKEKISIGQKGRKRGPYKKGPPLLLIKHL